MGRGNADSGVRIAPREASGQFGQAFELSQSAQTSGLQLPAALESLFHALERHHSYSALHSRRVGYLCRRLAACLGWPAADIRLAEIAGLVHDIGKVTVNADLLASARHDLSGAETAEIQAHAVQGAILLEQAGFPELAGAARFHHERFNGAGYPEGIGGDGIPVLARLVAVCDSYEAMTAPERSYRRPVSDAECQRLFATDGGVLFDPEMAVAFATSAF